MFFMRGVLLWLIITGFLAVLQPCLGYGVLNEPFSLDLRAGFPDPHRPDGIAGTLTFTLDPGYTLLAPDRDGGNVLTGGLKITPENSPHITDFQIKPPKSTLKKDGAITRFVYQDKVSIPFTARMINGQIPPFFNLRITGIVCKTLCISVDGVYPVSFNRDPPSHETGYGLMLLFAFLGGLILNFMPCVLPVLSLKLKALIRTHKTAPGYSLRRGMVYSATGILTTFFVLAAVAFVLDYVGEESGWGMHFQNPPFLFLLCLITTLFAANLGGFLDFSLPTVFQTPMTQLLGRAHHNASFYMEDYLSGVFATFLATPCTAPLLGTALGYAFTLPSIHLFLFFCVMGLGFSTPYWTWALLPDRYLTLPKPGPWMDYLSKALALFILGGVLWLLWILNGVGGTNWSIPGAISVGILALLLMFRRFGIIGRRVIFTGFLMLIGLPFLLTLPHPTPPLPVNQNKSHGPWQSFSPELMEKYQNQNQVVFLEVTADWCFTCQLNKYAVLETAPVQALFQSNQVQLVRADFTRRDPAIARLLKTHNRGGIPFNVVFGPGALNGIVLPEIIQRDDIIRALNLASTLKKEKGEGEKNRR